ncbi:IclR family transcriptional regulator [Parapusillimonas granuli]|uniref:IclR family transcriptional regulator n=1 Tax=Parapusillimonas granuli TaxID=380911 RepID=A0A853FXE8_9BURK|nr:IclR family transcriptional regulator [Parapusillimonas granuli]MBB5215997.1 DNA-binding IclR family transcriptional regulator [Parapusillimonas granuli]NYT50705.1 IclR family transcriptional regulator [Parapusillimonas granuli]
MLEPPAPPKPNDGRRSIQSVETGFPLLAALVDAGVPLTLRDLAARAGMTSAKAHPYLVSFSRVGLVQQDPATSQYELGPFALQMGLVSLQRLDPIRIALPHVQALANQIGHTLAIAVLGSHGPTMVHISEASYPVHVNMRTGTVMSMLHTATGHVFAAWLPPKVAQHYIEREIGDKAVVTSISALQPSPAALSALLEDIRKTGMARALGNPLPGIDALSVPVFNHSGNIVLALTSLGPSPLFDAGITGPTAQALKACAAEISRQLGYRPARE